MLAHNKEKDEWQLQHPYYPDLTLTMEEKDILPVGLHSWLAGNNTCNLGQTSSVQLQLSACLPGQFTCRDGKCIGMDSRCDNIEEIPSFFYHFRFLKLFQDCDDSSDEKNCRMVSFDAEKYLKNKPPPSPHGIQTLPVTVRYFFVVS